MQCAVEEKRRPEEEESSEQSGSECATSKGSPPPTPTPRPTPTPSTTITRTTLPPPELLSVFKDIFNRSTAWNAQVKDNNISTIRVVNIN